MRKKLLSISTQFLCVAILFLAGTIRLTAQAATATWALTANNSVAVTGNVTGTVFTANSVNAPSYGATGVSCSGWSTSNSIQATDYYEYKVTPTAGNMFVLSALSFIHQISSNNAWEGAAFYSLNNFSTAGTQIGSDFAPSTTATNFNTTGLSVLVTSGQTLTVRVYAWNASNGTRSFRNRNVVITGTTCANVAFTTQPTSAQTLCAGNTLSLTGAATNATSYQWRKDGAVINGATSATYTKNNITTADAATYTLDATRCGTIVSNAAVVNVNPSPSSVTATPSASSVCLGGTINLTAAATSNSQILPIVILNENFNAANSWTTTNTSTGGTPANGAWILRADGFVSTGTATTTWHSNDNSQFYLSNSDAQGNGAVTATTLVSPAFSTTGMASASLSYYQYYRALSGQTGIVEISNNGSAWTTLVASPGGNVGSANGFLQNTIALPAGNLNQATVYIRFRFNSSFGWYWGVDNVNVTGTPSAPPAPTYAWTSVPAGFTSSLQNPTGVAPTVNTVYTVTATNNYGCGTSASTVSVVVNPVSVGGTVTTSTTVCSGTNSGTLFLNGQTGNVIRWESSLDNFATAGTTIGNTTSSLIYTNLTATTSYRAVVQSGVCTTANSVSATVTVNPVSIGGAVGNSITVCSGSNSGSLLVSGHVGNVIRWESSLDDFATPGTPIAVTNTSLNYSNLTATTSYRAVIQSGVCAAANSTSATVTINPVSVGGTVATGTTVCSGTNSGTLTLSGHIGNVIRWESSLDGFATAGTPIANATTSLSYNNITATTSYRAVVQNGICGSANSVAATITVNQISVGGNLSGAITVCANSNGGSLNLSGYVGNIIKWQSSDLSDFSVGVLDIPNTNNTLSFTNISATTYYRAVVSNGVCGLTYSSVVAVTVDSPAVGGTISGTATVCYGNNNGSLNLSGNSGAVIGWESSLNNFATAGVPISNTTTTQNFTNLTGTTYYRAIIGGSACGNIFSAVVVITVDTNTTWSGANGSAWNIAANWSCGVVPTSDVDVSITSMSNNPIITADAFARTVTMDPGTTLTIESGKDLRVVGAINGIGNAVITVKNNANLIQELDVANSGSAVVERASAPILRLDYTLWSSPVTGAQTLLNFSPNTLANRFYIYNPSTDLYNAVTPSSTTFTEGTGYLIRIRNNHQTDTPFSWVGQFSGTLNNGDVNIPVTSGTFNAIGNPYPSTIDADMFITENNITEALYFWRKTNDALTTSYATYTLAGGAGTSDNAGDPNGLVPNGVIQVGQGFIAKSTSSNFNFNNGMRLGNNSNQFFRASEVERNRIWLNLTNAAGIFSQTMVAYMTGATYGVDAAIDGPYFNDSQLALTSLISNNEYAIQGRSLPFDNTDIVPLGFKAIAAGNYTIGIDHADGLFANVAQDIFIKDNLDGSYHNLRAGDYTFVSEAGVFNGRFEIVYMTDVLAVTNPVWNASQVIVYKQGDNVVVNSGKQTMSKVKVFDIRGRLLAEKENINASETKLFTGTANQVLIVKITATDNREVIKKVMN